jgi:hypothetical protein
MKFIIKNNKMNIYLKKKIILQTKMKINFILIVFFKILLYSSIFKTKKRKTI